MKLSKVKRTIKYFLEQGGTVNKAGDIVVGPDGKTRKLYIKNNLSNIDRGRYYFLTYKASADTSKENRQAFGVHQLQAAIKFGFEEFSKAECVRHLDGNSLNNSWENIAIGSIKDNHFDMTPAQRVKRSDNAAITRRENQKFNWEAIKRDRACGMTYPQLIEKYGVCRSSLSYNLSDSAKRVSKNHSEEGKKREAKKLRGKLL